MAAIANEALALKNKMNARDGNGKTPLYSSIRSADDALVERQLKQGADPNLPCTSNGYIYPIHIALDTLCDLAGGSGSASFAINCNVKEEKLINIIHLLKQYGADLKVTRGKDALGVERPSALAELAISFRLSDWPTDKLNDTALRLQWEKIRTAILAAHRANAATRYTIKTPRGLKTVSRKDYKPKMGEVQLLDMFGYKIRLEKLTQGIAGKELADSYTAFMKDPSYMRSLDVLQRSLFREVGVECYQKGCSVLKESILAQIVRFAQIDSIAQLTETLSTSNRISIIPTLTTVINPGDHAMVYIFYNDYCVRVNCGATASKSEHATRGTSVYKIKDKDAFKKIWLKKFINSQGEPIPDNELTGKFLEDCCGGAGVQPVFRLIQNGQEVDNCCWKSDEAALFTILWINLYKVFYDGVNFAVSQSQNKESYSFSRAAKYADVWYSLFLAWDRQYSLENYRRLNLHKNLPTSLYHFIAADAKLQHENMMAQFAKLAPEIAAAAATDLNSAPAVATVTAVATTGVITASKTVIASGATFASAQVNAVYLSVYLSSLDVSNSGAVNFTVAWNCVRDAKTIKEAANINEQNLLQAYQRPPVCTLHSK